MSRGFRSLLVAGVLLSQVLKAAALPKGPIVPGHSIAGIELGMREARVKELLGEPSIDVDEARHYPNIHMTVFIREKLVESILFVRACQGPETFRENLEWAESIKTAEGVGLGQSADAVRKALGAPEHERRIDASMIVLSYPTRGIILQVGEVGVCVITVSKPRAKEGTAAGPPQKF